MEFKRVALYVRVSTDAQTEGYSIEEQINKLKKYCEVREWAIYNTYTDGGYSGSNIDRPALSNMIDDIDKGKIDLVLVYKLDRLSRSQKDTLYLIEEKFLPNSCDFISITENFDTSTPFGRAMIGILSVFAQLERENIKSRMLMGKLGKAKSGLWAGTSCPPIGYDYVDGKLIVNEYEAMQIRELFNRFLNGESLNSIKMDFAKKYTNKYSSYQGNHKLTPLIKNIVYIGKINHRGQIFDGQHEAIIDEKIFYRVQNKIESNSKYCPNRSIYRDSEYLLTGFLWCGICGSRLFVKPIVSKGKTLYYYYTCDKRNNNYRYEKEDRCFCPTFNINKLDKIILDEVKKLKVDDSYFNNLVSENKKEVSKESELKVLQQEIEKIDNRINKLIDLYTLDNISKDDINNKISKLYENKNELENQITNYEEIVKKKKDNMIEIKNALENMTNIDNLTLKEKRNTLKAIIDKIIINEDKTFKIHWKFN